MRLVFEIAGDKQIERELLDVGSRAVNAAPAFSAIGRLFIDETRAQFESEGGHASGGWTPLKQSTLRAKRSKGQDPRILHGTLALERSLTDTGDPNMVLEVGPGEIVYGSQLPYARFHQTGTRRMPRRRPVEFTEDTRQQAVRILLRFIREGEVEA